MKRSLPSIILALLCAFAGCHSHPTAPQTTIISPASQPASHPATSPTVDSSPPQSTDPRDTVPFLASDALAGRVPGTPGLVRAGDFLASEFSRVGLQTLPGLQGYFQPFVMPMASSLGPSTNLLINDKSLSLNTDFSPISMTGQGPFNGNLMFAGYSISSDRYDDFAGLDVHGKVVLALRQEPRDEQGHSRLAGPNQTWSDSAFFGAKAKAAADHGAVALLLVNRPASGGADDVSPFFGDPGRPGSTIPVIQVSRRIADMLLAMGGGKDLATLQQTIDTTLQPQSCDLHDVEIAGDVQLKRSSANVRNIIGYIPGVGEHADEFVIVGAHYDHLGTGQLGNILGPPGSIYHGADDNASGAAAIVELAQKVKRAGPQPASIIFALFTAEEEGLIGSAWFVKHPPIPLSKVVGMLNLDMVGRLKNNNLLTGGWGTAPIFDSMLKQAVEGTPLKIQSFEKGGLGPSDHMSFALQKIPVLFLFTGLHPDYHRPTDTADKINYSGIDELVDVSQRIVDAMAVMPPQQYDGSSDSKSTMAFVTGHSNGRRASLGVVPEFNSFETKNGVPISGVSDASPAQLAGLRGGDIMTMFNDKPLNNLQDLSDALSQANPGDKVTLKVTRDGKPMELHAVLAERKE